MAEIAVYKIKQPQVPIHHLLNLRIKTKNLPSTLSRQLKPNTTVASTMLEGGCIVIDGKAQRASADGE